MTAIMNVKHAIVLIDDVTNVGDEYVKLAKCMLRLKLILYFIIRSLKFTY